MKFLRRVIAAAVLAVGGGVAYWAFQDAGSDPPHGPSSLKRLTEAAGRLGISGGEAKQTTASVQEVSNRQDRESRQPEQWIDRRLEAVLVTIIEEQRLSNQPDTPRNARAIEEMRRKRRELYREIHSHFPDEQNQ